MRLWIRFNLPCDGATQRKLHKIFRQEIKKWENDGLVTGAVLTYHFGCPSDPEILYLCLDIPSVETPKERSLKLEETVSQIPSEILDKIKAVCNDNQVKLGSIIDYEFDIEKAREQYIKAGKSYYENAPAEEILRFASAGTKIAIELLDKIENKAMAVTTKSDCKKLADAILLRLSRELGSDYPWLRIAFHFVCNPMLYNERLLWSLAMS
jgi:hypothetical protein